MVRTNMPVDPDFLLCHPFYGDEFRQFHCFDAVDQLPLTKGWTSPTDAVDYWLNQPSTSPIAFSLPLSIVSGKQPYRFPWAPSFSFTLYLPPVGDCAVSVESAGPNIPPILRMLPKNIRDTAAAVLHKCVQDSGLGGFATYGIKDLVDQVFPLQQVRAGALSTLPIFTTFITVTISVKGRRLTAPGNYDPGVPESIAQKFTTKYTEATPNSKFELLYGTSVKTWEMKTEDMSRGGTTPWWKPASDASDEMTYECDAGLGSPSSIDCSKIEWSQLGPPSDTVSVGPGRVTFLHSNTCYLAISASVALLLTWEQIRAAVSALMNVCVQHPFGNPQGGRAYYGHQPPPRVSGRNAKRGPTGLNALPPHANITVFQQKEVWTNPEAELNTCTWKAVAKGLSVTAC